MKKNFYEAPLVEELNVATEQGFAASTWYNEGADQNSDFTYDVETDDKWS